ncbi:MAG: U32 family peptidase [Firmicutes bacterium]|nr:U32 family peptidase [Bacillota bacterium]
MKKIELLSPAGSMDALKAAIHNGANAIYLGGKKFGARAFAQNFSVNELIEAINYAHIYNVKIYITVNTIIYEDEFENALDFIEFLYKNNVDAVIMQDIGLMYEAHKRFPGLIIHASTQCHNHNIENIEFFKSIGVKRVILDREMSLEEIKKLNTDMEIEIFIHGALCISYSGCCLMSYLGGGRSGNRGECTGCCRLPYKLIENNKEHKANGEYLISTKELNTSKRIKEIMDSNIVSLKIEGRMKSPEYVGFITKYYRNIIDGKKITEEDEKKLSLLFNRDFTEGYLFNENNITNIKTSNHQGIVIGKIIEVNKKFVKIKLNEDLDQEDGIRFENNKGMIVNKLYNSKMLLVSSVSKNSVAIIENKCDINKLGSVRKTTSVKLLKELQNYEQKKLDVSFTVKAKTGEDLEIVINDGTFILSEKGNKIEKSQTSETTREMIVKQLSKLGNTPFRLKEIEIIKDDNIFISITELNSIRRNLVSKLIDKKTKIKPKEINKVVDKVINYKDNKETINIFVNNEEQYRAAKEENVDNIYTSNVFLHKKYPETFYKLPRVILSRENITNDNLLITEIGSIVYSSNNNVFGSYELNAINNHSLQLLHQRGIKQITISPEINDKINLIDNINNNIEIIVYGWIEAMVMKHCIVKNITNNHSCNKKYYLKNKNNELYPIVQNNCLTTILNYKPINNIDKINYYKDLNIKHFRIDLYNENYNETIKIIKSIKNNII